MKVLTNNDSSSLVSCIITTYNREIFVLQRAIDSVLNQTHDNLELIIVNDSPENIHLSKQIKDLIESYANSKLTYLELPKNSGACFARNKGAELAKGDYLAFLDDDDEWLPTKLEKQLELFTDEVGIVYCDNYIIQNGKRKYHQQINPNHYNDDFKEILRGNFIGGVSFPLLRKDIFWNVGGFDINFPSQQDTDLYIRIIRDYKAVHCAVPLLNYYVSEDSITSNISKKLKGYNLILKKYDKYFLKFADVNRDKNIIIGNVFYSFGEFAIGKEFYSKAKTCGATKKSILSNKFIGILKYIKRNLEKMK